MARKIVITSGKGGVGKTTFTANLGSCLAGLNKKVVMIDVDLGLNNLDVVCGVEKMIVYDIVDVVSGKCRAKQALIQTETQNLFVMPSSQSYNRHLVTVERLGEIVDCLSEEFDYILLDCPAGIDEGFYKATLNANEAIILTTPHISALRDADKVYRILLANKITDIKMVVNRARGDLILENKMLSIEAIERLIKCPLLGVLPESDLVSSMLNAGKFVREEEFYEAMKLTAKKLHYSSGKVFDPTQKYKGFLGGLKRRFKRI